MPQEDETEELDEDGCCGDRRAATIKYLAQDRLVSSSRLAFSAEVCPDRPEVTFAYCDAHMDQLDQVIAWSEHQF